MQFAVDYLAVNDGDLDYFEGHISKGIGTAFWRSLSERDLAAFEPTGYDTIDSDRESEIQRAIDFLIQQKNWLS